MQTFLVGMRDHFGDTERGTSMYKVFLNTLVATSGNAFACDIAVKSRDAIKLPDYCQPNTSFKKQQKSIKAIKC